MIHDHTIGGLEDAPDLIFLTKKVAIGQYCKCLLEKNLNYIQSDKSALQVLIAEGDKAKDKVLNYAVKLQNT